MPSPKKLLSRKVYLVHLRQAPLTSLICPCYGGGSSWQDDASATTGVPCQRGKPLWTPQQLLGASLLATEMQKAERQNAKNDSAKCAAKCGQTASYGGRAMIVKKIRHTVNSKPKEWQIGDLVDYIRNPDVKNKGEKIEHAGGLNFLTDTHSGQKLEMIALARETVRSKMPVTHYVFSWPEGEQPTRKQVDELVEFFLREMGMEGHQAIYGLHCDTRNYHVHIAVNRVHPETLKVTRPNNGFDIRQAHKIRAMIEKMQGWAPLENSPYVVTEEGDIAQRITDNDPKPSPKAVEFEKATGEKSAQRIAQERGHEIIKNAKSWDELHEELKKVGLRLEKKGSGAIIWVGETAIKASSVDRSFSMGKLAKKLGEFVAGNYEAAMPKIEPEPLNSAIASDLQIFQAATRELAKRKKENAEREQEEREQLLAKQKLERQVKLGNIAREHCRPILNIASYCLKIQQREERQALRKQQTAKRPSFARPKFNQWLLQRGKNLAASPVAKTAGLSRQAIPPLPQSSQAPQSPQAKAFLEYTKAVDADRYRVTAIKMEPDGSRKFFILDKKDGQSMGFTPDELVRKMPEILKLQKRGENIYYTPLSEDKHHILIDDVSPENVVRLQKDGYKPAVIIESSPRNFQCILRIPKFGGEFDRQIANQLAAMLNKEYGDPKLSGAIHPHRAPGFGNFKPKHRRADGAYPLALLRFAVKQICKKALVEARKIELALKQWFMEKEKNAPKFISTPGVPAHQNAYFAHYENIRSHLSIEDFSRVDAMIALRMRANGHSPEAVLAAIRDCAPLIRTGMEKRRDWQRYAERTSDYAFGFAGDRDLQRNARYFELWQKVEGFPYMTRIKSSTRLR